MLDVQKLLKAGSCKRFLAGTQMPFKDGQEAEMYILISGAVEVCKNGPQNKLTKEYEIKPLEVFGGREFFFDLKEYDYKAKTDSVVFVITKRGFMQLAKTQQDIMFEILQAAYVKPGENIAEMLEKAAAAEKTAAEQTESQTAAKKETGTAAPASPVPAAAPAAGGIYPEGHMSYPGITKPEYAKLVFAKTYTCPFCKKKVEDFKIFTSKLVEEKPVRYDLRRYYAGIQTEWYDVVTCPECYFSTLSGSFAEPKSFTRVMCEEPLKDIKKNVTIDFKSERTIDYVFTSHYLAFLCAPAFVKSSASIQAKLWANLSWLYEDVENEAMVKHAAVNAAAAYEKVYLESTSLSAVQEQQVCLTIAGMLFKAGEYDNIKRFIFNIKKNKTGNKVYIDLADDLLEKLREMGI